MGEGRTLRGWRARRSGEGRGDAEGRGLPVRHTLSACHRHTLGGGHSTARGTATGRRRRWAAWAPVLGPFRAGFAPIPGGVNRLWRGSDRAGRGVSARGLPWSDCSMGEGRRLRLVGRARRARTSRRRRRWGGGVASGGDDTPALGECVGRGPDSVRSPDLVGDPRAVTNARRTSSLTATSDGVLPAA